MGNWDESASAGAETMTAVPCGTCKACCINQHVILVEEDEPNLPHLKFVEVPIKGVPVKLLASSPTGACVHLTDDGCGVYEHRPMVCREYDCRKQFFTMTRGERRQFTNQGIWDAARARLPTLDDADKADIAAYRERASAAFQSLTDRLEKK